LAHLIMGTAGHIDHGKTALIKSLTGIDCDTHQEEKKRGITINLGFAYLTLSSGDTIGIIDVPGHRDFVHTMVGGACGLDFALMVVAADSGVMPQTHEHLQIMDVLGVRSGLVAITKIDLVEPEIVDLAEDEIKGLVSGTFMENCPIVRVSAINGDGLNHLKECIEQVALRITDRPMGEIFRMFIDRIFSVKGFGTVVTGSVIGGTLHVGDTAYLLPGEKKLRVRRIECYGKEGEEVVAGDRAAINLVGLTRQDFKRGMIISKRILRQTKMVDTKLRLFNHNSSFTKLWNRVIFHLGTYEQQARAHLIDCDRLTGGNTALVQIHLESPLNVQYGDRFVIRNTASDITLGGGVVIDAFPLLHRRRPGKVIESMTRIAEGKLQELVALEVRKCFGVVTHREIADLLNVSPDQVQAIVSSSLPEDVVCSTYGDNIYLIVKKECDGLEEQLLKNIAAFHRRNPLVERGRTTEELMGILRIDRDCSAEIFLKLLLNKLEAEGKLKKVEHTWALYNHTVDIGQELNRPISFVSNFLKSCKTKTPLMSELIHASASQNIDERGLNNILRYLVEKKEVYYIDDSYLHACVVDQCRKMLLKALTSQEEGMTVAEFRNLVKGNRKICLLLLAIYDSEGITQRSGDLRLITEKGIAILKAGGL